MFWNTFKFLLFTLHNLVSLLHGSNHGVTVDTANGPVFGYTLNLSNSQSVSGQVDVLNIFLGIPYAEPPVRNLRFARPVSKHSWAPTILSAKTIPPVCPQAISFIRR